MTTEAQNDTNKGTQDQSASQQWFGLDLNTCSLKDFTEVATGNLEAKKDYLENQDKFSGFHSRIEALAAGGNQAASTPSQPPAQRETPAQQPQAAPQAEDGSNGSQQPEELVELKIPRSLLGTYLTGRTNNDGVIEALKGKAEADKTLKEWGEDRRRLHGEAENLRQQLLDATVKLKTVEAQPKPAPVQPLNITVEEIDFSAMKNLDLMDPNNHELIRSLVEKGERSYQAMKQAIANTAEEHRKAQPIGDPVKYDADKDPDVAAQRRKISEDQTSRIMADIDYATSQSPQLRMSKPFKDVDTEVRAFFDKVMTASGFRDEAAAVKHYFGDTPESKAFRDICTAQGIVKPSDYEKHQAAFRAYKNWNQNIAALRDEFRANPPEGFRMVDFIAKEANGMQPPAQPAAAPSGQPGGYQSVIEQHNRQAQANSTPPGYIPDIPPSVGSRGTPTLTESQQDNLVTRARDIIENHGDMSQITVDEAKWLVSQGVKHSRIEARSQQQ
jgi:hypothetical protein